MKKINLLNGLLALGMSLNVLGNDCVHNPAWESNGHYLSHHEIGHCSSDLTNNISTVLEIYPPSEFEETVVWYHNGNVISEGDDRIYFTAEGEYWAKYSTNINACVLSDTITVTSVEALPLEILKINNDICSGGMVTLIPQVTSFDKWVNYKWSLGMSTLGANSAESTSEILNEMVDKPGIYHLMVDNGCSASASIEVQPCKTDECNKVKIQVQQPYIEDGLLKLCTYDQHGETIFLNNVNENDQVSWFHDGGVSTSAMGNTYNVTTLGEIYAYYEKDNECYISDTITAINQVPGTPYISSNNSVICSWEVTTISVEWSSSSNRGIDYDWSKDASYIEVGNAVAPATYATLITDEPGVYSFQPYSGHCIYNIEIEIKEKDECNVLSSTIKQNTSLSISPNPVQDILTVNSTEEVIVARILDDKGHVVDTEAGNVFNVSSLQNSHYWLEVTTKAGVSIIPFIKD